MTTSLYTPELRSNAWHRVDNKKSSQARSTHATGSSPTALSADVRPELAIYENSGGKEAVCGLTNPATRPLKPVLELNKSASRASVVSN